MTRYAETFDEGDPCLLWAVENEVGTALDAKP